ncbi:hypothetical protein D9756_010029 [Leucocoprinus leucothites]|uniref:Uncharacterized protein n=1 Tax=Leucocoprinus leucothites TaxID=201217 RepID=A0A8H5CR41_9AGAR|nr:hypothetical protein D9756_010029 [Leucoagaricus leucothites]
MTSLNRRPTRFLGLALSPLVTWPTSSDFFLSSTLSRREILVDNATFKICSTTAYPSTGITTLNSKSVTEEDTFMRNFTTVTFFNLSTTTTHAPHSSQSFSEPSRPDLFYHIVQAPTPISKTLPAYALSFSSEKPPSSLSTTIIGWLPAQEKAREGTPGSQSNAGDATLADFVVNPAFVDVLHSAIKDGLTEGVDEIQKAGAMQTVEGWMHIHDERNLPALNRIGEPDDIIGTVLVENSEIRPETYQPMPAYRLVTADGLMQLTPGLAQKLKDTLAKIAEAEKSSLS